MSRIGKSPIPVPSGVDVTIAGRHVTVKGPKGTLERDIPGAITVRQEGDDAPRRAPRRRAPEPRPARPRPRRSSTTWSSASPTASARSSRSSASATAPPPRARASSTSPSASATRSSVEAPDGITFEVPAPDPHRGQGHRQGAGRPGGRQHPRDPQARALQGQGRPLRRRARAPQGRQGREVGVMTMQRASRSANARIRRHRRVRKKVQGTAERPRLAVFRSNKHIVLR